MITGALLRDAFISGANNLANHSAAVDELNVFPVPDGDTGTNMTMTMRNPLMALEALSDECTVDEVASLTASGLLRGARGNSGVILSLIFRGFSRGMKDREAADSESLWKSLRNGVDYAYKAVMKPTEGTMLTVARLAAEHAETCWESNDPAALFHEIYLAACDALAQTPEMLPVLKKAGVVDAGGKGLCLIFEGIDQVLSGGEIIEHGELGESLASQGLGVFSADFDPEQTKLYCTEFIVNRGENSDPAELRAYLESIGDSVVVVDDEEIIKCHVHTKRPDRALRMALKNGALSKIKIESMYEQFLARQAQGSAAREQKEEGPVSEFPYAAVSEDAQNVGIVAVCAGAGLEKIYRELGASAVVSGGQTMNPSTDNILEAIQSVDAKTVLVLANNKNIIMASQQACSLADRKAVTLTSTSVQAGISAMLMFDPFGDAEEVETAMNETAEAVKTASLTFAARDAEFDGQMIAEGSVLGLEGGKVAFTETDLLEGLKRAASDIIDADTAVLTLIIGADVSAEDAETAVEAIRGLLPDEAELSVVEGGQPVYYYYLSAE